MNLNQLNEILEDHKLNFHTVSDRLNLRGLNLRGVDLQGVSLRNADLREADLRNAYLWNADLKGVDLRGADLRNTSPGLALLHCALYNKETVFPSGFDPVASGMKLVEEKEEAIPATTVLPTTLNEELSEVLAKHGLELVFIMTQPSKNGANQR